MAVATSTAMLLAAGAGTAGTLYAANNDQKIQEKNIETSERQKRESLDFIQKTMDRSRGDLFKLFPAASESRHKSMQFGLELLGQTIPAQMDLYSQGNQNAQNQVIAGNDPRIAALTGGLAMPYAPQASRVSAPQITMPALPERVQFPQSESAQNTAPQGLNVGGY